MSLIENVMSEKPEVAAPLLAARWSEHASGQSDTTGARGR